MLDPGDIGPGVYDGTRFGIGRIIQLVGGAVLIEWPSIPGMRYAVEYSPDLIAWSPAAGLPLEATNSRIQWIDHGPPKTPSAPTKELTRYYRAVLLTPGQGAE